MIVVIDTNAVLSVFASGHAHGRILTAWMEGRFAWAVSTEILLEYEEIMQRHASPGKAVRMNQVMDLVAARHNNLSLVSPTFRFHLITADPDDDKFADCAITAGADYIITSDGHFGVLRGSGYQPQPLSPEEFIRRHLGGD